MITLENINKTFRVAKRQAGFGRAVRALFSREYELIHALDDISFTIGDGASWRYLLLPRFIGQTQTRFPWSSRTLFHTHGYSKRFWLSI
jgi:hypothetical protein